jgi:BirA family biotin operon repressor/biotin-[acetyl-CoA-carboxylase] ligase
MSLGRPRLHLRLCASTNDRARELAAAGAPHGALVTATAQSAGRGRQGRAWVAAPGSSVLMTLVLRDPPALLPLAGAVAVAQACGDQARIKWPNDVLTDGGKVAGILAEGRPREGWAVLGIGLNVAVEREDFPPELRETAATLGLSPSELEPMLARLLDRLDDVLALEAGDLLDAYRARDALRGHEVRWATGHGIADGVDGEGRLVVALPEGGRTALDAGEVHLGAFPGGPAPANDGPG